MSYKCGSILHCRLRMTLPLAEI
ncbi:hypothetical protein Gohar_000383 [Gossypium harknessii]|uniref:Uncharacterized protein n=1 Tax=Gossypium harknessii TaxID=34285 RepID=A0A7J9I1A8_9ROSI|nr:hypothetical protein [Gossypium harknessii]